ncbi:hypothetical protein GUJ93_ZPchr0004g38163 [Zizania palustris]|uniref:Uncharacterized protein n=1 Tax=Zizania palustris TaxID=103762 RepID=A0A8J5SZY4_ZIZPA|nr:hypothetical protein GUJ93_ZPchr0004g38163 [Zizania palustris]
MVLTGNVLIKHRRGCRANGGTTKAAVAYGQLVGESRHGGAFPKAVKTDAAAAAAAPKFYPADDVKPRQPSTRKPNATKLRSSNATTEAIQQARGLDDGQRRRCRCRRRMPGFEVYHFSSSLSRFHLLDRCDAGNGLFQRAPLGIPPAACGFAGCLSKARRQPWRWSCRSAMRMGSVYAPSFDHGVL